MSDTDNRGQRKISKKKYQQENKDKEKIDKKKGEISENAGKTKSERNSDGGRK